MLIQGCQWVLLTLMQRPSEAERPEGSERQTDKGWPERVGPHIWFNKRAFLKTKAHCWLSALCVPCLMCVRVCTRGLHMYGCMCETVWVSLWVLSTRLMGYPRPLFVSLLLAGLPVWESLCLKRPAEGFKDRVGREKVMNIKGPLKWKSQQPLETKA